jgi:hypothetical protein
MTIRLNKLLEDAKSHQKELELQAQTLGSFAHKIAAQSISHHIDEINQQITLTENKPTIEQIEFRVISDSLNNGSVPLNFISKAADEIRQMIGYAALQLIEGNNGAKRVSENLYNQLDLRLAAVLRGSSRLVITTASQRNLFDESLSKNALERIFDVLESRGQGEDFLQAVATLGARSSRHLRYFLTLIKTNSAQLQLFWRYSGETVREWNGNEQQVWDVIDALDKNESVSTEEVIITGVVELLSKRERIYLITSKGEKIRILFPKRLLEQVSTMHLDQYVALRCSVTETENPLTKESFIYYELMQVMPV